MSRAIMASAALLLLAGAGVLLAILRSRPGTNGSGRGLSEAEEARLRALLDEAERDS